jgi:hypothetical protein
MMQIVSEVPIAPKLLAEAFWNMDSNEQAQFFAELHDILDGLEWPAHSLGEMQWLYMAEDIEKDPRAKRMACALMASIYLRTTDFLSRSVP